MNGPLIHVQDVDDLIAKMETDGWRYFLVEDEQAGIFTWKGLYFQLSQEGFRKAMDAYESSYRQLYPRG